MNPYMAFCMFVWSIPLPYIYVRVVVVMLFTLPFIRANGICCLTGALQYLLLLEISVCLATHITSLGLIRSFG